MKIDLTRRQVLCIGWSVSLSAGFVMIFASAVSAATHSGWFAMAAFAIGMLVIAGASIALIPAWRRPTLKE
jgi:hypothetical protein